MRRFLILFVLLPLALIVVALSVANRQPVSLQLNPFAPLTSQWSLTAPMYVLLFAALVLGVVVGGVATWSRQRKWRQAARREHANAERLRQENERLRQHPATTPAIAGPPAHRDAA